MNEPVSNDRSDDGDSWLVQARGLIKSSRFVEAERLLTRHLADADDGNAKQALYTLAVAQRYQKHYPKALTTLRRLQEVAPDFGRGFQELGHHFAALNIHDKATAAFEKAVQLNPALLASWQTLATLHGNDARPDLAQRAMAQVTRLRALPPELLSVSSLIHENEWSKAEHLCRHFLRTNKQHVEGMRLLAEIAVGIDRLDDAEFLLESCVEFEPDYLPARIDYAGILLKRQKFQKAHEQAEFSCAREPGNLALRSLLGSTAVGIGANEDAVAIFDEVLEASPSQSKILVMRGHALKTSGRFDQAIESYQRAYRVDANHGDAFWSLANTKVYAFSDAEIAHMQRHEASASISANDRAHMCFALGKAFEDRDDFESSFKYYALGNELKQVEAKHRPARLKLRVEAQIEVCTAELFAARAGLGCQAPDPIFVVGLPRAGSTLLEQILASHSMVDGTLELPHIVSLANRLRGRAPVEADSGPPYPRILGELDEDYFHKFGEQYIADTQPFRAGAARFIDKMPNNFFHIGLIRLILPNAKIIDARRHPMACCFSGFKQLFGEGQEFSYGLVEIGNYYREYVTLMDHWDEVLPGFVHRVQHEAVVDDLETEVRRMLDFCELPFEQSCIDFHKTSTLR